MPKEATLNISQAANDKGSAASEKHNAATKKCEITLIIIIFYPYHLDKQPNKAIFVITPLRAASGKRLRKRHIRK